VNVRAICAYVSFQNHPPAHATESEVHGSPVSIFDSGPPSNGAISTGFSRPASLASIKPNRESAMVGRRKRHIAGISPRGRSCPPQWRHVHVADAGRASLITKPNCLWPRASHSCGTASDSDNGASGAPVKATEKNAGAFGVSVKLTAGSPSPAGKLNSAVRLKLAGRLVFQRRRPGSITVRAGFHGTA